MAIIRQTEVKQGEIETVEVAAAAFADVDYPLASEALSWANANIVDYGLRIGTILWFGGTSADPEFTWSLASDAGSIVAVETKFTPKKRFISNALAIAYGLVVGDKYLAAVANVYGVPRDMILTVTWELLQQLYFDQDDTTLTTAGWTLGANVVTTSGSTEDSHLDVDDVTDLHAGPWLSIRLTTTAADGQATTPQIDLSAYTKLRIEFSYKTSGLDIGEGFLIKFVDTIGTTTILTRSVPGDIGAGETYDVIYRDFVEIENGVGGINFESTNQIIFEGNTGASEYVNIGHIRLFVL